MMKKGLMAVSAFYLLGVFGVAGGSLVDNWDDAWGFGVQTLDALQVGATWPKLVVDLIVGV